MYSVRPAVFHVLWLVHARGDLNLEIFRRTVLRRFQLIPLGRLGAGRRWPQQHLTVDNINNTNICNARSVSKHTESEAQAVAR